MNGYYRQNDLSDPKNCTHWDISMADMWRNAVVHRDTKLNVSLPEFLEIDVGSYNALDRIQCERNFALEVIL